MPSARSAGIRPVMITGDHKDTAVAIAKELGIITDASQAITGAELDQIPADKLPETVKNYGVYARGTAGTQGQGGGGLEGQ